MINASFSTLALPVLVGIVVGIVIAALPLIAAGFLNARYGRTGHRTADLAHQLKSPLSIMINSMEMIRAISKSSPMDETQFRHYWDILQRNTERLNVFVRNLQKVVIIGDGEVSLNFEMVPSAMLVKNAVEPVTSLAQSKGLTLATDVGSTTQIWGDSEKIHEALSNIVLNAIQYSEQGEIRVDVRDERGETFFSVTDQGRGLDAKEKQTIFRRFASGAYSKGSGLGLAIAKGWVEAHGGRIGVLSGGPLLGSCFWFTLPKRAK